MELEAAEIEDVAAHYSDPGSGEARRALLRIPPQPPDYAPHSTLKLRQLRLLMLWESCEALKLVLDVGLDRP